MNLKHMMLFGSLLIAVFVSGCVQNVSIQDDNFPDDTEWRCNVIECVEYVEIDVETWADQNCRITVDGTFCNIITTDGNQGVVPIESINLSAIQAQECVNFVCVEETPFRKTNYSLNTTN